MGILKKVSVLFNSERSVLKKIRLKVISDGSVDSFRLVMRLAKTFGWRGRSATVVLPKFHASGKVTWWNQKEEPSFKVFQ